MTGPNRTVKGFIVRKPLLTYGVLSYAFFWLFLLLFAGVAFGVLRLQPAAMPAWLMQLVVIGGSWMPAAAAIIVTGVLEGRHGIGNLFRKFGQFRLSGRWYLAALLPLGLAFVAAAIYGLAGGAVASILSLSLAFWVTLIVSNLLAGPTGEETGWRGFALPRLLARHSPLKAGLILGVVWDLWHLPVWILSGYTGVNLLLYCLFFSIGIISVSVIMTWIFLRTSNSLVPMAIVHFSVNVGFALIGTGAAGTGPALPLTAIVYSLLFLTAIVVWAAGGLTAPTSPRDLSSLGHPGTVLVADVP